MQQDQQREQKRQPVEPEGQRQTHARHPGQVLNRDLALKHSGSKREQYAEGGRIGSRSDPRSEVARAALDQPEQRHRQPGQQDDREEHALGLLNRRRQWILLARPWAGARRVDTRSAQYRARALHAPSLSTGRPLPAELSYAH